jgi:DNA-binding MarR family transcriptional regulator
LLSLLDSTSVTALSRNIADLSSLTTKKLPGPGLIELRTDPLNLRVKRVFLTAKGRRFMKRWFAASAA